MVDRIFLALAVSVAAHQAFADIEFADRTAMAGLSGYVAQTGDGHGPGAVFADLNGDGFADLYLMRAGNPNRLYLNVAGAGGARVFQRAANDAGAGDSGAATGALAADVDNDGDRDLYVINFNQPNALYKNLLVETGTFAFVDATAGTDPDGAEAAQYGLATAEYQGAALDDSLTAAFGDPDRDGDLDLYVGNHNQFFGGSPPEGPFSVPGRRDVFYRNNGDGTYTDWTMEAQVPGFVTSGGGDGTANQHFSSTNAVIFADVNNDGWPDLFVTNKVGGPDDRDMLYINQGRDAQGAWQGFAPITYALSPTFGHRSGGAMGVEAGDIDNDGDLDLYITDWSDLTNPSAPGPNDLWVNQLSETGTLSFVHDSSSLPGIFSWGTAWQDFNNDGRLDVHVAAQETAADRLYENTAAGFVEIGAAAGIAQTGSGRGDPTADYDLDGWQDLFTVVPWSGSSHLYRNTSAALYPLRTYLGVALTGSPALAGPYRSSRDAIGARVAVRADLDGNGQLGAGETQWREVKSGSGNAASTSSLVLHAGTAMAATAAVDVSWPSGRNTLASVATDQVMALTESLAIGPQDLYTNSNFAAGLDGWTTELHGTAAASWSSEPSGPAGAPALRVDVSADDGIVWHVQFYQGDMPVVAGQAYRLAFMARASAPGTLRVTSGQDHSPWAEIGLGELATLTTDWRSHEFIFVANVSDRDARAGFQLGTQGERSVWFANARFSPVDPADLDLDRVPNAADNCMREANALQRDTDADGFGNACDPDLNDDCVVNAVDLGLFRARFFTADATADFNGDGVVNAGDLGVLRRMFFDSPGPSAYAECADP